MYFSKLKIVNISCLFIILSFIYFLDKKTNNIKVCICTCGKEENNYVREFVEYYKKFDVDKIFIYDNNNNNGEHFEEVLLDYISKGFVEIIDFRGQLKIQNNAFNHCYNRNKMNYDWFIYYDIDEFIHLYNFKSIKNYLSQRHFNKCNIIYLNNVIHTDNNHIYYYNRPVLERFPEIENFKSANKKYLPRYIVQDVTKMILKGNMQNVNFTNPHYLQLDDSINCNGFGQSITPRSIHLDRPDHKYFYYDHFYFKSSEEYLHKLNVGDVFYGEKKGYDLFRFEIYFSINEITMKKLDYFEKLTGVNLTFFRDKEFKNRFVSKK